ncbi:MAG: fumarylacetoacetate hydrolase family protein, partial [Candidatus Rokubacteria bacterium]|nr:fumarylacetoacetate hydrolase family protein [Candidatus Rokubacteria bacterium]
GWTAREAARWALDWAAQAGRAGEPGRGPGGEQVRYDPATVRLCAPVPRPASLRDFLAFEAHTRAAFARRGEPVPEAWYRMPVYYKGNHRSIVGPDADVRWPRYTERLDYELELACVIGRRGRDLDEAAAAGVIAGYTVMNDWSARDIQRNEMMVRLGPAKGKDFATSLGPYLVTADELDPRNLRMVARVNGEVWSEGNSGTSHWTFPQMIAHVSQEEDVFPGDVLGSGTVGGGCGLELDRWLKPGDVVELEIEGIGVLRNRVVR